MERLSQEELERAAQQQANELAKNKAKVMTECLAEKAVDEAKQEVETYCAVAVGSEIFGPGVGIPTTLLYSAFKASKLKKAYQVIDNTGNILDCTTKN